MGIKKQLTIVLGAARNEAGEVLLGKRISKDLRGAYNKWELVGGNIDYGEDPEISVVRQIKEEAGLEVKVVRLLPKIYTNIWQPVNGDEFQVIILPYECLVLGGELSFHKVKDEIGELRFFKKAEVHGLELLPHNLEIINLLN